MICHEFKGGIGTASRVVSAAAGGWTVGVLVQANYGARELLRIDGVPVGEEIPTSDVPSPWDAAIALGPGGRPGAPPVGPARSSSSWRPTRRSSPTSASGWRSGPAWGSPGWAASRPTRRATSSSPSRPATGASPEPALEPAARAVDRRADARRRPDLQLFQAAVEATEEAIVNALLAAGTMTGADGITAHGLEGERVVEIMARYGRGPRSGRRPGPPRPA